MITFIQLEYITALDTYRHFATAAEKCFVTQPTLSMQVKKLEEELDVVLFDRTRQPVIPTEQGKQVIAQARVVLQETARIKTLINDLKQQVTGELRIGLIPTIAPYLLPLFAGEFKKTYPEVELIVEEAITEKIEEMLVRDTLDVGVVVTPLHNKQVIEYPLYYEEMLIYHHAEHPVALKPVIKVQEIDPNEVWLLGDGHCFRSQVINFCDIRDLDLSRLPFEFEAGSIDTLMKIIDREGGYTLIPELAALEKENRKQIKSFDGITPLREVSLVYTRKFAKTRLIESLAESIRQSVPETLLDRERGSVVEWRE